MFFGTHSVGRNAAKPIPFFCLTPTNVAGDFFGAAKKAEPEYHKTKASVASVAAVKKISTLFLGFIWRAALIVCFTAAFGTFPAREAGAQTGTRNGSSFQGRVVGIDSGDQIRVKVVPTWTPIVRLHGIICPTSPAALQVVARRYTSRRVLNGLVRVEVKGTGPKETVYGEVTPLDSDGRTASRQSLNEELIRVGLAEWAQEYAAARTELGEMQVQAQLKRRGMWGDPNGANVVMPTPIPAATPKPTPKPAASTAAVAPAAISPSALPTPRATQTPPPAAVRPTAVRPAAPPKPIPPRQALLWLGAAFAAATTATFIFLRQNGGFSSDLVKYGPVSGIGALPAPSVNAADMRRGSVSTVPTLVISAFAGLAACLLVPFPLLLGSHRFFLTPPVVTTLLTLPLLFVCAYYAVTWTRREQILRSAPRLKSDSATPQSGVVKIEGQSVVASPNVVYSVVGRIPGLYLREVTSRYEPQTPSDFSTSYSRKGKRAKCRWVVQHQDTRTTDFLVMNDTTPPVRVASEWAEFYPLRTARFYNEIPVDSWFNQAYVGDTRTEIHFLPTRVPVTVWGQVRQTAAPVPGQEENRMGYEASHDCLIVVEGDPARLWTRRPLLGLLMTLAGIGLAALITYCLLTPPEAFPL